MTPSVIERPWLLGVFLLCCTVLPAGVYADGSLEVTLTDARTERGVANVDIELTARAGERLTAATDDRGRSRLEGLEAGLYELEAEHPNYLPARLPSVRILEGKFVPVSIKLQPKPRGPVEEVVVVGSVAEGDLLGSVGTSFLDRESLRSAAGSGSDVLRALDSMPGLFADGETSSFTVRGAGPRDNLILVDGVPFANVVHFSQSFGEREEVENGGRYSVFAPNLISSAEFQPGGWSARYGGRSGSLLKLSVAEGNPNTPSYTARIDIAGFEVGYDGPSRINDDTSVLLSARLYDFGRFFETIGLEEVGDPELTDVIIKTVTDWSPVDKFELLAIYAPESYTRGIDNILAAEDAEEGIYEDVELVDTERDNNLLVATWQRLTGNNGDLTQKMYYRMLDEQYRSGEAYPDLVPIGTPTGEIPQRENIFNTEQDETEVGYRLDFDLDNRWGRLSTGLRITHLDLAYDLTLEDDWILYEYDQTDFRPDPAQQYIVLTPASINNRYRDQTTHVALYGSQEWEWSSILVRTGLRYDRDGFSGENLWSPRLGASWFGPKGLRVTATLGRYYQSPNLADRAADASNAELENEIVDQASLGASLWLDDQYQLFIETYYQDMANLIGRGDTVNQTFNNQGEGTSYGVDMALTRAFDNGWSADIKYSYSLAEVRDFPGDRVRDADYSRPHSASIGGIWELNERWKFSGRWKWASGRPSDDFIIHENVLGEGEPLRYSKEITARNTGRYGNYASVNCRIDYRRNLGRTSVIAFLDVINVFGSDNPDDPSFNERNGSSIEDDGQALPIIGFRLEW